MYNEKCLNQINNPFQEKLLCNVSINVAKL